MIPGAAFATTIAAPSRSLFQTDANRNEADPAVRMGLARRWRGRVAGRNMVRTMDMDERARRRQAIRVGQPQR